MPISDNPNISDDSSVFPINAKPGIQRDGTHFDADGWVEGQWCRFQRGRPKKMGGYREISNQFAGPIRAMLAHPHDGHTHFICGSGSNLQITDLTPDGIGAGIIDVTPTLASGFIPSNENTWQFAELYEATGGESMILGHAAPNLSAIDSDTNRRTWIGADDAATPWVDSTAPQVSGGVVANAPYAIVFGNNGYVAWCVPNQPDDWAGVGSGEARITKSKIVYGSPVRGGAGQAPAFIFISLDAVLRATFGGGSTVFNFDHVTTQSSILSSAGVIEYDGLFFWPGIDRFLMYNGVVQEVPNTTNLNYFFDNLNMNQRQKVWATKIPRYGEIIWHFPFGDSEECNASVIYNIRENIWYDNRVARSAGYYPQVFRWPVWADTEPSTATSSLIRPTSGTAATSNGGTAANAFDGNLATTCTQVATNGNISYTLASGANKTITRVGIASFVTRTYDLIFEYADDNLTTWTTMVDAPSQSYTAGVAVYFNLTEPISARAFRVRETGGATLDLAEVFFESNGYMLMQHEFGLNRIVNGMSLAIDSYIETNSFDYVARGPLGDRWMGVDRQVMLDRIEPDLIQAGPMNVTVITRRYPRDVPSEQTFPMAETPVVASDLDGMKMDLTEQGRLMSLRFQSNTLNGFYEMGNIMMKLKPGDSSV